MVFLSVYHRGYQNINIVFLVSKKAFITFFLPSPGRAQAYGVYLLLPALSLFRTEDDSKEVMVKMHHTIKGGRGQRDQFLSKGSSDDLGNRFT